MAKTIEDLKQDLVNNVRKLLAVLGIWLAGWLGFSPSWIFISYVLYAVWNYLEETKKDKLKLLRAITCDEKELLYTLKVLPSWVCIPDVERAEWMNQIIEQMWPFISTMVSDILKNKVGPEIQKKRSLLSSFKFEEVDLGNRPLKIGGVRVYTKHVRPNEIIMDAEIIYAGDADLKVCLKGVSAGISDLQIRGTLRIEIKPLLSKPPLIGGITFYFIDSPDFNFDLTNLLNVLDIPGLSNIVKAVLREVLDSYIVLPNRITIPMGTIGDLDAIKYPLPQGALRVKILEATDLPAHDTNVFKKNSSDPYVISKVGSFQHRTKTIKETLKPKWSDESFYTFVDTLVGSQIHFQIYDEDKLGKDDILGRVDLDLPKLSHSADEDMWLPLKDCKSGRMHITCGWNDFSDDSSVLKNLKVSDGNQPVACLFIKLENGKNLPATNMKSDTSCSFVEITIGNKKVQSKTQRNTKNPVWEELHSFFVSNPQFQTVNFKVLDNNADGPLGITEFSISTLLSAPGMKIKQAFPLKNCFTNGEIYMAIELKALIPPLLTHTNDQH